eukprot:411909-Prorocentrum_minimum.AAC.2
MTPGPAPMRGLATNTRGLSASRRPAATKEPIYIGAPLRQRAVSSGRIRPASAAELRSRGPAASSVSHPLSDDLARIFFTIRVKSEYEKGTSAAVCLRLVQMKP